MPSKQQSVTMVTRVDPSSSKAEMPTGGGEMERALRHFGDKRNPVNQWHQPQQRYSYHAPGLFLYLLHGPCPADWPLSSILPSVLEAGLSGNQSTHFCQKNKEKERLSD